MEPTGAPAPPPPSAAGNFPRSSNTGSCDEDNSRYHATPAPAPAPAPNKLRLMCSYGGHIVPRPHDKSLCYVGGDTRIVVVDRHATLVDLIHRLTKTLLRSSSPATATSFTLKYQLPSDDLDSLISVTTDEDLENMIDEYERLNSSSRLRLFVFPAKLESVSSIGSLLEDSTKSEDWFLNALNGSTSGFSGTSSVNCLLDLDDEVPAPEKKYVNHKGAIGRGNNSGQDVHSIPNSPMMETTSSFGSASSTPSLTNFPPIRVPVNDHPKVEGVAGIEEQFSQMGVQHHLHKHQDNGCFMAAQAPVVVTGSPVSSAAVIPEYPNRVVSDDDRSAQSSQIAYRKLQQQQQQQQSMGFDFASPDSVLSDPKPLMTYHDPTVQTQNSNNKNRSTDPNNTHDQSPRIQQQQQKQIQDSAYLHHHQPQFIHTTTVPPPQYLHHHPSMAAPVASYYQPATDHQNFIYYMPARPPQLLPQLQPQYAPPHIYHAAPPQSAMQYQTMTSTSPVEAGSRILADNNSIKQQQVRIAQP